MTDTINDNYDRDDDPFSQAPTDHNRCMAVIWDKFEAHECRNDNNSNVLCLPARVVDAPGDDLEIWKSIIDEWIETPFAGAARYVRRNAELDAF